MAANQASWGTGSICGSSAVMAEGVTGETSIQESTGASVEFDAVVLD